MDNATLASTPQPPYYAVIFSSLMNAETGGYSEMAAKMDELAKQQPGYLGIESARNEIGITVSYWASLEAIRNWKANADHLMAQRYGREKWYASYKVRICRVERNYEF
jgi:heme-degrading monooxygenase HmoA